MGQQVRVLGEGIFKLPEGVLVQNFNATGNVAVLKQDPEGPHAIGGTHYSVSDSVHLRGSHVTPQRATREVVELLTRNGAHLING